MDKPHLSAELKNLNGLEFWDWRDPQTGVRQVELTGKGVLGELEAESRLSEWATDRDYEMVAREDIDIYKPAPDDVLSMMSGSDMSLDRRDRILVSLRRNVIPLEVMQAAAAPLRAAAVPSESRGNAAGKFDPSQFTRTSVENLRMDDPRGIWARYICKDGSLSKIRVSNMTMGGIIGNFDRSARTPYCRQTTYTKEFNDKFQEVVPLLREIDKNFRARHPKRWQNQKDYIAKHGIAEKGWTIGDTAFTTATVNFNFRTAYHQDSGDLHEGFGNLTVLETGDKYKGCHTVFNRYRVAVDLRMGDFLCMDVHEVHGNTPFEAADPSRPDYGRCTLVCYCRENMKNCGTQEEERAKALANAKLRKTAKTLSPEEREMLELLLDNGQDVEITETTDD